MDRIYKVSFLIEKTSKNSYISEEKFETWIRNILVGDYEDSNQPGSGMDNLGDSIKNLKVEIA